MKVSPDQPFELIYSLYDHEYLGYLIESFVVQLNDKGELTFSHQNISAKNAQEFSAGLDDNDFKIIKLMDQIQQDQVANHFQKKKQKPEEFFLKVYDEKTGDVVLQKEIAGYVERRISQILSLIHGKRLFEMGKDGEPAWKEIEVVDEKATVLFHFRKNEDNTHYFPTIKLKGEKVEFLNNGSYLLCNEPAWLVANDQLFTFQKPVSGGKLKPFLKKKFILIPKDIEETYYKKFVGPLISEFDVYAKGFDIVTHKPKPTPKITVSELQTTRNASLFDDNGNAPEVENDKLLLELSFDYGRHNFNADKLSRVSVSMEKQEDTYTFHRISRDHEGEKGIIEQLTTNGLPLRNSRVTLSKSTAFDWIGRNSELLQDFIIKQNQQGKKFFVGESTIDLEVSEGVDWFDLKAKIRFGDFEVPFEEIRKCILKGKTEVALPNGEIGVIPESWITRYKDLFAFSTETSTGITLNKIHVSLVQELKEGEHAKVTMDRKLEKLLSFDKMEDYKVPDSFKGDLRPYQLAGYNWLRFLEDYNFGGCLADDMGLGKTIQALTLLQHQKNENPQSTSLLIMPTSLLYNWEMEAQKFTPGLKILNYTGINRVKDSAQFGKYDIVLTSYGTTRVDTEILAEFYFNYIILDESQAIKNPDSLISRKVRELKSRRKLILTGTPIENSTLDLWSQMSFLNPGLLGNESYFRKEYLKPIEKGKDENKTKKLNSLIKPFLLRREKSQVADDLPEKVINIRYCTMSEAQREYYEKEKNAFRSKIMDVIETDGVAKSHMVLLQGLTQLRQIANHPAMVDPEYKDGSGKLEEVTYMIENSVSKGHKVLIFSQFVKHLKIVSAYLDGQNLSYAYLDGSTKDRQRQVELFQNDPDVSVFLISLKAGGTGLNLTKADYVFLLDPWWNPAVETQAIDRAHRIGQTKKVFAYKFVCKDTIEEKIIKLQDHKQKLASDLITVEESFVKSLSQSDIQDLFD
ncbi:MAG: DEAD/DEAH box helicase [Ekhidna sp.]|uniref:DEAD/DEAH box helicase n=1 Tax=Ekhidna sp. TaxID=2608089 RepID=UPI0032EDFCC6